MGATVKTMPQLLVYDQRWSKVDIASVSIVRVDSVCSEPRFAVKAIGT